MASLGLNPLPFILTCPPVPTTFAPLIAPDAEGVASGRAADASRSLALSESDSSELDSEDEEDSDEGGEGGACRAPEMVARRGR